MRIQKKLIYIFRVLFSLIIIFYLLLLIDWDRVFVVCLRARLSCVWPAPLLVVLGLYAGGVRWSILLPYFGICLRAGTGFLYYLIGSFYGNVLPGVIGGDAVRIGVCKAVEKSSVADITASVLIERMCGILALLLMGTLGAALLSPDLRSVLGPSVMIVVPVLAGVSLVVLFAGYLFFGRVLVAWLKNVSGRFNKIAETVLRIIRSARKVPPANMVAVFFLSVLFQFADILASFFLARAINIDVPLLLFLAIFPIVYIMTVLPISLGGLGVREGTLAYLLTRVGVLPSDAVMFSFLIYLNRVLVSLIGGALQVFWKPAVSVSEAGITARREAKDTSL